MRNVSRISLVALFLLGSAGCARSASPQSSVTLDVYAAASLSDAFGEIATRFHESNPDVRVVLNFGGSTTLAQQIREGAPADVVALADSKKIDELAESKNIVASSVTQFARNSLSIIVERGNPKDISTVNDLAKSNVITVLCDVVQPCGANAETVLKKMDVIFNPVSRESNVNGVVQKVASGEADAGIVYVTDAKAHADTLDSVDIPMEANVINSYPIAIVSNVSLSEQNAARKFISFVSREGSKVLTRLGFAKP